MSDVNTIINKMKDIYILSKQSSLKTLNIIKTKNIKDTKEEKQIFFNKNEKKNNKKYNKKNITILKYISKNKKYINLFGNTFVKENRKKCRITINKKKKKFKVTYK